MDRLPSESKQFWLRVAGRLRAGATTVLNQGPAQLRFWLIALLLGLAAGQAAVAFRFGIATLQQLIYGADDKALASHAAGLPWPAIVAVPIIGGLIVGVILNRFTTDARCHSVAHVIEGAAIRDGRVDVRAGIASTLASFVTLSTGGSTGREGPVVHIGAILSTKVAQWMKADGVTGRDLMGCAVAAAVSASFNAPIAGALFALEVVLRHFAVHAFAPIVVASVAGTVLSRLQMGNVTEFLPPGNPLALYVELPAFMILGLVSGVVAAVMMWSVFAAEDFGDWVQRRTRLPGWLRPAVTGAMLGGIAVFFPHIIGVGYETTSQALTGNLVLWEAVVFAVVKVAAVAITIAGRMGGGVFSPSLMLGALTGLAFGWIATALVPGVSASVGLYALAGMGAVAASVLGAPISTTLIVFEMTSDWQAGIAVMVSVSLSTAITSRLVDKSFFLSQLARRGAKVAAGPQAYLLATIPVGRLMRPRGAEDGASDTQSFELVEQGAYLRRTDTLDRAMPMFDRMKTAFLPVVDEEVEGEQPELMGALYHIDALRAYNRALAATAREEHS